MLIENGTVFTGNQFVRGLSVRIHNGIVTETGNQINAGKKKTK